MERYQNIYLVSALKLFKTYHQLSHAAINRLSERDINTKVYQYHHTISELVKSCSVNIQSRWTPFATVNQISIPHDNLSLTISAHISKSDLLDEFETVWQFLFNVMEMIIAKDLDQQEQKVDEYDNLWPEIDGQLTYIPECVSKMVELSQYLRDGEWESVSLQKGKYQELSQIKVKA